MKKIYLGSALISLTLLFGIFQNCSSGSLPTNATNASSSSNQVANAVGCLLDNQTVESGYSVSGVYVNSVGTGQVCPLAATLTCTNGIWSGGTPVVSTGVSTGDGTGAATSVVAYSTCAGPTTCQINGATVNNGSSVAAYSASTVAYGVSCSTVQVTLSCSNGAVASSGGSPSNYVYSTCAPGAWSGTWNSYGNTYSVPNSSGSNPTNYYGVGHCPASVSVSSVSCTTQNALCWTGYGAWSDSYNTYYPKFRCK